MQTVVNQSKQELLQGLEYVIFSGRGTGNPENPERQNQAYLYWKRFWSDFYEKAGQSGSFSGENFYRQDFVTALFAGDQVVGLHLYSLFRIDELASREHRYFKSFPEGFIDSLKEMGVRRVMSLEYLTVDPGWRKSECGLSLAEVLIGCGTRFFRTQEIQALIAPARADGTKVAEKTYRYGFDCFQSGLQMLGCPIDIIVGFRDKIHHHPSSEVMGQVERLWSRRQDYTGRTRAEPELAHAA